MAESDSQSGTSAGTAGSVSRWNVPNLLSMIRLFCSAGLVALALAELPNLFAAVLLIALVTDWVDGKLAVMWKQQTSFGARLDTVADAAMYGALVAGLLWMEWETMRRELGWLIPPLAIYAISCLGSLWKFRRVPSYHTRAAKCCWLLVSLACLALFWDDAVLPLRVAAVAVSLTNLEAVAITAVLDRPRTDVPSLVHAWRLVRDSAGNE